MNAGQYKAEQCVG